MHPTHALGCLVLGLKGLESAPAPAPTFAPTGAPVNGFCQYIDECTPQGWEKYTPSIEPAFFSTPLFNPYWPMNVGSSWTFETLLPSGRVANTVVNVTHDTIVLMGVTCTVFTDVSSVDGVVGEFTRDYYAADNWGNVWYFGEDTTEYYPDGSSSTDGSWQAGVGGALPGIVMTARPIASMSYRQEYKSGVSEDMAMVVRTDIPSYTVPAGTFTNVLETLEWSPLEADAPFEHKYYAAGVGVISTEEEGRGGKGAEKLVSYSLC